MTAEADYDIWTGSLSRRAIAGFASAHADMDAEAIASAMIAAATEGQLRMFAASYVRLVVDLVRRERAREAEDRAAAESRRTENAQRLAEAERQKSEAAATTEDEYQRLFDDPTHYPGNAAQRKGFRKWAGDRFGEWYERGCKAAAAIGEKKLVFFEADWYEGGSREYFEVRRMHHTAELIRITAEEVRLETTRELLTTVFALGDGTETTWGDATVDQHGQRIELLTKNAAGIMETAARHQVAIRMIEEAGVKCLADLAGDPA